MMCYTPIPLRRQVTIGDSPLFLYNFLVYPHSAEQNGNTLPEVSVIPQSLGVLVSTLG